MPIHTSTDLLLRLHSLGYDDPTRDPWWWPDSGTFGTVISAVLTQNTTWRSVERSLEALRKYDLLKPHTLIRAETELLEECIRPSGYYRNKARNLQELTQAMLKDFGDFETFARKVGRDWLMARRGIGNETADAILNYACYREAFVVDSYTARLLEALGYPQPDYAALQRWMLKGIEVGCPACFPHLPKAQCYARYHGMVVEYCKANRTGGQIEVDTLIG